MNIDPYTSYLLPMSGGISTMGEYYINIYFESSLYNSQQINNNYMTDKGLVNTESIIPSTLVPTTATTSATSSPTITNINANEHKQLFRVQVDTGSSSLLIPSNRCTSCHQSKYSYGGYDDLRIIQNELGNDIDDNNNHRIMCNSTYCGYGTCSSTMMNNNNNNDDETSYSTVISKKKSSSSTTLSPSSSPALKATTTSSSTPKATTTSPTLKASSSTSSKSNTKSKNNEKDGNKKYEKNYMNNDNLPLIQNCPSGICSPLTKACCSSIDKDECGFYLRYGIGSDNDDGDGNGNNNDGNSNRNIANEYKVTAEGKLMRDKICLDTINHGKFISNENAIIYVVLDEKGPWPSKVDGIFGLGYPSLNCNPTCSKPAFETIPGGNNLFTICMGDKGGKLLFGSNGIKENLIIGNNIQWTSIISGPIHTFYTIEMTKLIMDNEGTDILSLSTKMAINSQSKSHSSMSLTMKKNIIHTAIIDSGTTLLMLNEYIYQSLVIRMRRNYCHIPGICGPISKSIFTPGLCLLDKPAYHLLPTLTFSFGKNVDIIVPPQLYFIRYLDTEVTEDESYERGCKKIMKQHGNNNNNNNGDNGDNDNINNDDESLIQPCYVYCFGIQSSGMSPTIIGDTVMRGYTIVFDRKSSKIGFASPNRTTCGNVADINNNNILLQDDNGYGTNGQNHYFHKQKVYFFLSIFIALIATITALYIIANATGLFGIRSQYQQI